MIDYHAYVTLGSIGILVMWTANGQNARNTNKHMGTYWVRGAHILKKRRAIPSTVKLRDPDRTRRKILKVATREFSKKGLSGARVDTIASKAQINKRMIYHYFGGKESLYQAVIEEVYEGISEAAKSIRINDVPPLEGISRLVDFVSDYCDSHPESINLLHEENLYEARHLTNSSRLSNIASDFAENLGTLVSRGKKSGKFSPHVTPINLYVTIVAMVFYFRSHKYTLSIFLNQDLKNQMAAAKWKKHIEEIVLDYVQR